VIAQGCAADASKPDRTIVIAAVGEPSSVLPPLAYESVARDIGDRVYERLADLAPGAAPIDTGAFRPRLAASWERIDPLALRFRLRSGARWHDGRPVTAADVVFSFEAFSDLVVDALARPYLAGRVTAEAEDSMTVVVRFASASPEQLFDATSHVRIIPRHVWSAIPREGWAADTAIARLVGSGPWRLTAWRRGEFLSVEADTARPEADRPEITGVVLAFSVEASFCNSIWRCRTFSCCSRS
jgi:peptide/nickel transport system substrate-binding protein